MIKPKPKYVFRDEFLTARAAGAINGTASEPSGTTRTTVNTENCLSIIPNLSAVIATHAGVTFGGSNNRCSYAANYSWLDFPTGFNAAAHAGLGRIIVIYDSVGVAAWAYLGAAGTGETLGSEKLTNPTFDINTTGWSADRGSIASIAGGQSGNCLELTSNGTAGGPYAYQIPTSANGELCLISVYAKDGSAASKSCRAYIINTTYGVTITTTTSWQNGTKYAVVNSTNTVFYIHTTNNEVNGATTLYDEASFKQVLTPSATGVYVYKDAALTTNGWNKPTAFNMNSASYTFGIYEPTSGGKLFFQGGKSSPAYGDPGLWEDKAIKREVGRIVSFKANINDVTNNIEFGLDTDKTGQLGKHAFRIGIDLFRLFLDGAASPSWTVATISDSTDITLAIILRSAGAEFFRKLSTGYWKFLWKTLSDTTATLYAGIANYSAVGTADWIRVINTRWLPPPIVSDSFAGADGSADGRLSNGLGHLETTGIGSGGAGAVWSGSTATIASNRLVITPTLGSEICTDPGFDKAGLWTAGIGWSVAGGKGVKTAGSGNDFLSQFLATNGSWYKIIYDQTQTIGVIGGYIGTVAVYTGNTNGIILTGRASSTRGVAFYATSAADGTVDNVSFKRLTLSTCFTTTTLSTKDVTLAAKFTMQTGLQAGIVFGMNEAGTSFGLVYHDGNGNVKLEICENGTWTTKATTAIAYSADAELVIRRDNNEIWCWYGATPTIVGTGPSTTLSDGENTNLAGLKVGLFSTSELNSFSSFTAQFTGTNNEFSILDRLIGA